MEEPLTSAGSVCHILVDTDLRVESVILLLIQIDSAVFTIAIVVTVAVVLRAQFSASVRVAVGRVQICVLRLGDFAFGMWIDELTVFIIHIITVVIIVITIFVIIEIIVIIVIAAALQRILLIKGIVLILAIGQQRQLRRGLIECRTWRCQGGAGGGDGVVLVVVDRIRLLFG